LCGTSISDYQVALASRYCDNFVIILDSDDAGNIAAKKSIQKIEDLDLMPFKLYCLKIWIQMILLKVLIWII